MPKTTGSVCVECRSTSCVHLRKRPASITARQLQVIALMGACETNKEIAFRLGLSETTVKQYAGLIYRKLGYSGAGSRSRMILWARDNAKLLQPPKAA